MPVRFYLHDLLPSSEASELHTAYNIQVANLITEMREYMIKAMIKANEEDLTLFLVSFSNIANPIHTE